MEIEKKDELDWTHTPQVPYVDQFYTLKRIGSNEEKEAFLEEIIAKGMKPFYENCCSDFNMISSLKSIKQMEESNVEKIKKMEIDIEECRQTMCETDVRDAILKKIGFLSQIGMFEDSINEFKRLSDKTLTLGYRLDIIFHKLRIAFWNYDHKTLSTLLLKAKEHIDEGGDWDRRNKLKVYQGLFSICKRDFETAANLFLETVATFSCSELLSFKDFIRYCVLSSIISLKRPVLYSKIIRGAEIQQILYYLTDVKEFVKTFYDCLYDEYFLKLAAIEQSLEVDRYLTNHSQYYARQMRLLAYMQLLQSYKSVTLEYMANRFGVTIEYMDRDLYRFISCGKLKCKIDKVNGSISTSIPDSKNSKYQEIIKYGDILLQRTQKLCNFINV
ncbi:26S proteasome non-ATPase regulatory subunit 6 [Intoshia linei]|uniref:26S proteasome non-ATPase regulatory subunit 6 n=1 Tax=Intoshia linei TaxID=1819745 RepID=A0A177B6L6_9BILA|nr:26S proteasome non-ATPase regulatory subunit 6 [Intoshia linei]